MIHNLSHSYRGMRPTASLVRELRIAAEGHRFDSLIGIGISGALVVPTVGRAMRKYWGLIRKDGVYSHANDEHLEGTIGGRFLIVDDFVGSGATVATILNKITLAHGMRGRGPMPIFIGVWQYEKADQRILLPGELLFRDRTDPEPRRVIDAYLGMVSS